MRVDNIKMDLLEIRLGDVDWIGLVQNRDKWRALANVIMNLRVLLVGSEVGFRSIELVI
jgi:hypothetical protein